MGIACIIWAQWMVSNPRRWRRKGTTASASATPRSLGVTRQELRSRQVSYLMKELPCGSDLLDLGCGAGYPTTKRLAEHFAVTGVDISQRQVERARRDIPEATFIRADMTSLRLWRCSFDAVTAFFSIISRPSGRTTRPDSINSGLAPTQRLPLRNDDRQRQGERLRCLLDGRSDVLERLRRRYQQRDRPTGRA